MRDKIASRHPGANLGEVGARSVDVPGKSIIKGQAMTGLNRSHAAHRPASCYSPNELAICFRPGNVPHIVKDKTMRPVEIGRAPASAWHAWAVHREAAPNTIDSSRLGVAVECLIPRVRSLNCKTPAIALGYTGLQGVVPRESVGLGTVCLRGHAKDGHSKLRVGCCVCCDAVDRI